MAVKQIISADCDAIQCYYEKSDKDRSIHSDDPVYSHDDTIFHARCFEQMTPNDVAIAFRIELRSGHFRPSSSVPSGADGLPDLSAFVHSMPVGAHA